MVQSWIPGIHEQDLLRCYVILYREQFEIGTNDSLSQECRPGVGISMQLKDGKAVNGAVVDTRYS